MSKLVYAKLTAHFDSYFTEKTVALNEPVDPTILTSMQTGVPQGLTGIPQRPTQENDAIPRVAPKWLKHDRQVSLTPSTLLSQRQVERRKNDLATLDMDEHFIAGHLVMAA